MRREKGGETDSHLIQLLKEIQKKLDEWLKKLNERIESEDITRFEVRFLEILRNILEWIKEKVDAKIESAEKEKPQKRKERNIPRDSSQGFVIFQNGMKEEKVFIPSNEIQLEGLLSIQEASSFRGGVIFAILIHSMVEIWITPLSRPLWRQPLKKDSPHFGLTSEE